jgi:hypothetical protein
LSSMKKIGKFYLERVHVNGIPSQSFGSYTYMPKSDSESKNKPQDAERYHLIVIILIF